MEQHVRYAWDVHVVPVSEAQDKLSMITLGTWEVYATHIVNQSADGQVHGPHLVILARQHEDVTRRKKYVEDAAHAMKTKQKLEGRAQWTGKYVTTCSCRLAVDLHEAVEFPNCQLCQRPVQWMLLELSQ